MILDVARCYLWLFSFSEVGGAGYGGSFFIRVSPMLLRPHNHVRTHLTSGEHFLNLFTGSLIADHCLSVDFTLMFQFCSLHFYNFIFPFSFFFFLFHFFNFFLHMFIPVSDKKCTVKLSQLY